MDLPVMLLDKMKEVCGQLGVYYNDGIHQVYCCKPTDKALEYIETGDGERANEADCWNGNNLYILHWQGEGVKGVRQALAYLQKHIGPKGILAGERRFRPRRWKADYIRKRSERWEMLAG